MERGCVVGNQKRRRTSTRGGGRRSTCQRTSSLLEVTLPEMFGSDLSDKEEFKAVILEIWRCLMAAHRVWWAIMVVMIVGMVMACSPKKHWMMRQSSQGSQNKMCKLV